MSKTTFFQLSQILFLVILFITIVLFHRRTRKNTNHFRLTEADLWELKKAQQKVQALKSSQNNTKSDAKLNTSDALQVGQAFPSWTVSTPASEVLGVQPHAPPEVIESAYKTLLKKYHPDRFQSWGADYVDQAHRVVFRLQQARDELLKRKV